MDHGDPFDLEQPEGTDLEPLQIEADLQWLLADPRGRRTVRRLLAESGIWRSSFTGDALGTAFREGERNAGLRLFAQVSEIATPEQLAEVMGKASR